MLTELEKPLPLGQRVQAEQLLRGGNIHTIAEQLGVKDAPLEALPPSVRKVRQKLDAIKAKEADAEVELNGEVGAWRQYQGVQGTVKVLHQRIIDGQSYIARCQAVADNYERDFAAAFLNGWPAMFQVAQGKTICQAMIQQLEVQVESVRKELAEYEAQATALQDRYDFA